MKFRLPIIGLSRYYRLIAVLILLGHYVVLGCGGTKVKNETTLIPPGADGPEKNSSGDESEARKVVVNLVQAPIKSIPMRISDFTLPQKYLHLRPEYPVAQKLVNNYYLSSEKTPGGHCLAVAKARFEEAYKDVYGHEIYEDLPDSIATEQLSPSEVFDNLFDTATKRDPEWQNLPLEYRAKGSAGALAMVGMGDLIDSKGVWSGELRPGAMVQVWRLEKDFEKVRRGARALDFDPYGHSFIFLEYVYDEEGIIEGMRIADQGYQSYRPLVPRDYEVWWGVNIKI